MAEQDVAVAPHAAGVMFLAQGKMLLLKRGADAPNGGTWCFPGGSVEEGESAEVAAKRESLEEVGCEPGGNLPLVGVFEGFALYLCECEPFIPTLNWEHDGYVWATKDVLPQPLHPGVIDEIAASASVTAEARAAAQAAATMDESARQLDINGWYEVKRNPLSKVGVFPYMGRQIPGAEDPDKIYMVYRPAEELASPECIASFRLLPWIDNHEMLGPEEKGLTPAEQKGVQGVIGEQVEFDPQAFEAGGLFGNIKVFAQYLAGLIKAGKRELSCGYRCIYVKKSGTFKGQAYDYVQTTIRGNHLALVDAGRMGPEVSVLDGSALDHLTFTIDAKEIDMPEATKKDGSEASVSLDAADIDALKQLATVAPALIKLAASAQDEDDDKKSDDDKKDEAKAADTDPEKKDETGKSEDDEAEAKKDDEKKDDKPAAMDEAAIFKSVTAQIARRDALAAKLSDHVGTFDHSLMNEAEVAAYGIKKLGLTVPAGQEIGALTGYLAAAAKPGAKTVPGVAQDTAGGKKANFVTRHINKEA